MENLYIFLTLKFYKHFPNRFITLLKLNFYGSNTIMISSSYSIWVSLYETENYKQALDPL